MSSQSLQYERFLSIENFKLAFVRLGTSKRNLYKSLYYEDLKVFDLFLDENISSVINSIKQGIYSPEKCHKIFIPKKDYFVRPLSLLTLIDLLVYQALVNVIADESYDIMCPHYDNILFGNIINPSNSNKTDRQFFFRSWKKRWKKFNDVSKNHYNNGYKYLSEFDIASFFDTIDHNILCQILKNTFSIDQPILDFLSHCLKTWTGDSNHHTFESTHGIPQGPISSPLLADLYLFKLDSDIKTIKKLDFKYLRYVDDIRILTKDETTSRKIIATLDLYSRDLGLIPQASKILIKEVHDIDRELKTQNAKFSDIIKEYKEDNKGKPAKTLRSKTHKQLKKRFLNCFKEKSDETLYDKTVISFSLYKLNCDEEIKKCLLMNYNSIVGNFEAVLYYLKTHYFEDNEVIQLILSILNDENILFHHMIALCFKYFPNIPFDDELYRKYITEKHRHWLVNYYMIGWLFYHDKRDLILIATNELNHFINRELNYYKYRSSSDKSFKKILFNNMLSSKDDLIALQGLSFMTDNLSLFSSFTVTSEHNHFVKYIFNNQRSDFITHTIGDIWSIENSEQFFNETIWNDERVYEELRTSFFIFIKSADSDPSKALMNLNTFNNLLFDKLCYVLNLTRPASEYGVNLDSAVLANYLPVCNRYWIEINSKRNQNTDAHPYDKTGNIRVRITAKEFGKLFFKQMSAMRELCSFNFTNL